MSGYDSPNDVQLLSEVGHARKLLYHWIFTPASRYLHRYAGVSGRYSTHNGGAPVMLALCLV